MSKSDNLEGRRFGRLEVVSLSHKIGHKRYWNCKCDCGNIVVKEAWSLLSGGCKSCGCNSSRLKDLTGQRFGRLTVIKRAENKGNKTMWLCKCDCGNEVISEGSSLKNGDTKSCGCLRREKTGKRYFKDLTGQKFGMLTVLKRVENKGKDVAWLCSCDCGKDTVTTTSRLNSGMTKSCGCLKLKGYNWKHEGSNTRIYNIWQSMKQRCFTPSCFAYKWYGERGISICSDWLGENGFLNFRKWSLEHGYKDNLSIDRIDVNGNYEPSNCRWATAKEQGNNTRNNRLLEYKGVVHTISEWASITGINPGTLYSRAEKGWSDEKCIETPVRKHGKTHEPRYG